jgi:hypothetical protein
MTGKLVRICVISKHQLLVNHSRRKAFYRLISQVHTPNYPLNKFLVVHNVQASLLLTT